MMLEETDEERWEREWSWEGFLLHHHLRTIQQVYDAMENHSAEEIRGRMRRERAIACWRKARFHAREWVRFARRGRREGMREQEWSHVAQHLHSMIRARAEAKYRQMVASTCDRLDVSTVNLMRMSLPTEEKS